jgi:hypothetical protein
VPQPLSQPDTTKAHAASEQRSAITATEAAEPAKEEVSPAAAEEPALAREITQTDHLNKKLLSAAMARFATMFPSAPANDDSDSEFASESDGDADESEADGDREDAVEVLRLLLRPTAAQGSAGPAEPAVSASSAAQPAVLRIVDTPTGVRASLLSGCRLPTDITSAQTADQIAAVARQIQQARAGQQDDD